MHTFEIKRDFRKEDTNVIQEQQDENIYNLVDNLLGDFTNQDINLAVWISPDMDHGEILILESQKNDFTERELITITKK